MAETLHEPTEGDGDSARSGLAAAESLKRSVAEQRRLIDELSQRITDMRERLQRDEAALHQDLGPGAASPLPAV